MTTRLKYLLLAILMSCLIWGGILGAALWFTNERGDGNVTAGSK
jgi:hypothetical protein